jgi:uncharacterized protein
MNALHPQSPAGTRSINQVLQLGSPGEPQPGPLRRTPGARWSWLLPRAGCLLATLWLAGCFNLKPARDVTRFYVLAPLPVPAAELPSAGSSNLVVGLGPVTIPAYLEKPTLAVRHGTNELTYLETCRWAENLDRAVPRVLAQDLSAALPSGRLRVGAWLRRDITMELHVRLLQFEVDDRGQGTLVASWRLCSPGEGKTLQSGETRLSQAGPEPAANPAGAVNTLSELLAALARELARQLQATNA